MNHNKLHLASLLALAIMAACTEEPLPIQTPEIQSIKTEELHDGMTVLGQELQDPYRIDIMRQAYSNLTGAKEQLQPTHLYMRFLPKNEDEYDALKYNGLELFDIPLNYEIAQPGTHYHDPSLPAEAITWQYAVIPVGQAFPENIEHELLYEAFIPSEANDGAKGGLLWKLEAEAMRLAGHANELISTDGAKGEWNPSGTITVWDDAIGKDIPLVGAKVRARRFVKVKWATTDANGYYRSAAFSTKVNYDLVWEQSDYDIRDGRVGQAKYNGPTQTSPWNEYINSGIQLMFATVHRAAYKMFYGATSA